MDNNNNNEGNKKVYHELINFAIQGMSEKYLLVVELAETTTTDDISEELGKKISYITQSFSQKYFNNEQTFF